MKRMWGAVVVMVFLAAAPALGDETPPAGKEGFSLLTNLKPYLQVRPRYEYVDAGNPALRDAHAGTVRTVLGLGVEKLAGLEGASVYLEGTNVSAVSEAYDSTSSAGNRDPRYAAVADPTFTRMTQAYLRYDRGKTRFIAGRYRLTLDDHRFIGDVGWRQMPQTFGVVSVRDTSVERLDLFLAYLYERKGVRDELNNRNASALVRVGYDFFPELKAALFGYLLANFHDTYGLRLSGSVEGPVKLGYLAEYAFQTTPSFKHDYSGGKKNSDFYNAELSAEKWGVKAKVNFVRFGKARGAAATGFSTPYATLHAFEGWADVILPKAQNGDRDGFTDIYGTLGYTGKALGTVMAVYHKFDSIRNDRDYGDEWDFLYARNLTERLSFLVKAAIYNSGDQSDPVTRFDVRKVWVMLTYEYK